ncbi:hypothetical protein KAW18_01495 [candidate division WOR-3 bacterium]|nr:hypothetical protein [candidate division WOR-3 bacterium]
MTKELKRLIKNKKGVSIVLSIFITFLLLICIIIINMSLGPVLQEVVSFSNSYMAENPSENMGIWRTSLNDSLKFYSASTFIICLGLVIWLFITSIRKEYKTFYR